MNPRRAHLLRDEEGSILPLTIFYGVLSLVLILLVVATTSLYLERKRLFTLADGAAIAGAEAFQLDQVSKVGGVVRPALDSAEVRTKVETYIRDAPSAKFDRLTIARAQATNSGGASVTLAATWHPPVASLLLPAGIRIDVTSQARSIFG